MNWGLIACCFKRSIWILVRPVTNGRLYYWRSGSLARCICCLIFRLLLHVVYDFQHQYILVIIRINLFSKINEIKVIIYKFINLLFIYDFKLFKYKLFFFYSTEIIILFLLKISILLRRFIIIYLLSMHHQFFFLACMLYFSQLWKLSRIIQSVKLQPVYLRSIYSLINWSKIRLLICYIIARLKKSICCAFSPIAFW